MNRYILVLSLGVGAILVSTQSMQAQAESGSCAPHESVVEQLAQKYGETRQSFGLAQNAQVVELFASLETGSWTIIITRPTGISCMVAAGQNFERIEGTAAPAALGDPA